MKIDQYTSKDNLTTYLKNKIGFLKLSEIINEIEIAGEGNMNVVLRIKTNKRTFILKQSRPFVQKYPHLPAPIDRIDVEKKFYDLMDQNSFFPKELIYYQDKCIYRVKIHFLLKLKLFHFHYNHIVGSNRLIL